MKTYFTFSPVRMDEEYTLEVKGKTIVIGGEEFDFSPLPKGAQLPASAIESKWFTGKVIDIDGELHITLILPHGSNAPYERRFPEVITYEGDGVIDLPLYDIVEVIEELPVVEPSELEGDEPVVRDPIIDPETHEEIPYED